MNAERPVRTVIVDDEAPSRRLLRSLLLPWPRIEVVGEAADGDAAAAMIAAERPDLVFLDVQLPLRNGFDVVGTIGEEAMPLVVFVTAYDHYALRAFEVSACDYLLKPFDGPRLTRAVERALLHLDRAGPELQQSLRTLLRTVAGSASQLVVKAEDRYLFLEPDEVDWIESAGKSVHLHLGKRTITVHEGLSHLAARLDDATFVRVHRSAIVNRQRIREVQPWFRGEYVVVLRDGTRIVTGNRFRSALQRLLPRRVG